MVRTAAALVLFLSLALTGLGCDDSEDVYRRSVDACLVSLTAYFTDDVDDYCDEMEDGGYESPACECWNLLGLDFNRVTCQCSESAFLTIYMDDELDVCLAEGASVYRLDSDAFLDAIDEADYNCVD